MDEVSQVGPASQIVTGDDRPVVYRDNGHWIYRASAIGGCPRGLLAARRGYRALPPPGWLTEAAEAGNLAEQHAISWLKARGWHVRDQQQTVEWAIGETAMIRGHIDGIGEYRQSGGKQPTKDIRLVEIKSMSDKVFTNWRKQGFQAFPKYAAQLAMYMTVLKLPAVYVIVRRETGDIIHQLIDEPPVSLAVVIRRVLQTEAQAEGIEWPVCEAQYAGWCAWQYLHDVAEMDPFTVADTERIQTLAALYDDQKAVRDQAEQALSGLKQQLVQLIGTKAKIQAGLWSVSTRANTLTKLDEAALFEACRGVGIDPAQYKSKVTYPDPILTVKKGGQ